MMSEIYSPNFYKESERTHKILRKNLKKIISEYKIFGSFKNFENFKKNQLLRNQKELE